MALLIFFHAMISLPGNEDTSSLLGDLKASDPGIGGKICMRNIRVYIAIETFLPLVGGSEKQAFLQSKYLRARGIEATILTMRFQRDWPACENIAGIPVLRVAGRILAWHDRLPGVLRRVCYLFALFALGWRLWRSRYSYDVLHVFQLTIFTLPALIVCRLARKPLVVAMRCDSPQIGSNQLKRRRSWADLDGLARLGKPALRLIDRQLSAAHAQIVVLSSCMRESLRRYGLISARVHLIPNGVDAVKFSPGQEQDTRNLTVVCVAQFRYQKGIDVLLRAWCSVLARLPSARLVLVGTGPLFASLQRLAGELGIAASVEFAGLCDDVPSQLRRGRIAVLPSRWEGMPNALLEAMSCGLACVATRVSGSEDLLLQGERGLLVEPEDEQALTTAMLLLLQEPELARSYGLAARQHIEQHYAFCEVMNKHIELYCEVIGKHDAMYSYAAERK